MEKCAHPACKCTVADDGPFGDYCSEHCREAGDIAEIECECGHPECNRETEEMLGEQNVRHTG
jgi:hypothetical protein